MISRLAQYVILLAFSGLYAQSNSACAQQPTSPGFDHLSVEDGLPQSTVYAILQDRRGFLWFGTQDGLSRYDGSGCGPRSRRAALEQRADGRAREPAEVNQAVDVRAGQLRLAPGARALCCLNVVAALTCRFSWCPIHQKRGRPHFPLRLTSSEEAYVAPR